jgi:hypothetical protein
VVLSRSKAGSEQDLDANSLRFDLLPPKDAGETRRISQARLEAAGYPPPKIVAKGELQVGRRKSVELELRDGCARIDVWSEHPMHGVEAWLWSEAGELIANGRGGMLATLFACTRDGTFRLDAEALVRPGTFQVELRNERETPKVLTSHPLAGSRLLSRMFARGVIKNAHQVGAPRRFKLSSSRLERMDVLVPVGRCVDITLALDRGASGAEIRLIDTADQSEISLVRGPHSTSTRACALDRPSTLNVSAEFRVNVGETSGLVATRMLAPRR